jgi:hypothetical protein
MRIWIFAGAAAILLAGAVSAVAQTSSSAPENTARVAAPPAPEADSGDWASAELAKRPWEWGAFFQGGLGIDSIGSRWNYTLLSSGVRLGKVITGEHLPGLLRGQFEYAGELMPYWEALTPPPHRQLVTVAGQAPQLEAYGGGAYHGFSITPIILRWDFQPHGRFAPWVQAAGGLIYTTHKFPPDVLVAQGTPGGTSVFNFTPQGGIGVQYFVRPHQSIMLEASGIHISSSSLGDKNPGVNESVQLQIGYTFWSR